MRFLIVGCGLAARFHARAIECTQGAELYAVCDENPARAHEFAARCGAARAFSSLEDALSDQRVEAVCVCTPSGLHARTAIRCLLSGRHVLVEKPMATTLEDCDAMLDAARRGGALLSAVSQLRFSPDVRRARDAVRAKAAGQLLMADADMRYFRPQSYYDQAPWRGTWAMDGGGTLMNQGIHGVDLMQYIAGGVREVTAFGGCFARRMEGEDTLCASGTLSCGAPFTLRACSAAAPGFARVLTFTMESGTISLTEDRLTGWYEGEPLAAKECRNVKTASDPNRVDAAGHAGQIANLMAAARGEEPLIMTGEEGRKPVAIVLAAYASLRTGAAARVDGAQ